MPPDAESEHLVSRKRTGDRLRAGSVPVTEIRAGVIVGPGSAAYEVIRDLVHHLPLMLTLRWVRSRSAPIALSNLLEHMIRVPELAQAAGRIYDAAGPEYLSCGELMRQFGSVVGRQPRILPVPVLMPRLPAYWLGLITACQRTSPARWAEGAFATTTSSTPSALRAPPRRPQARPRSGRWSQAWAAPTVTATWTGSGPCASWQTG